MKIGIIREGKNPPDKRVPFTPKQLKSIQEEYAGKITIQVQTSPFRAFTDQEFIELGIEVVEDISDCDVLFGVKEVPIANLVEGKTYFSFRIQSKSNPIIESFSKPFWTKNPTDRL